VVALATGPAGSSGARPAPLRTLFATLVLAAAAGAAGGLRAYGLTRARRDVGPLVAGLVDGAVAGVLVLLAAGFAAAAAAVAFHHDRVASLLRALHPRGGGWLPLLLLGIAAAPNAAIWLTAYAAGTGFSIGVGSVVAPTGVRLDAVPAFPLLGALPAPGAAPAVSLVLLLTPLAAAVVAATVVTRRVPGLSAGRAAAWLLVVGIGAGVVVGALCWIAGGAAGPGALRAVGPSPWVTAAAVAEEVGLVGAAVAAWQIRRNG
jgi:hypothetical protein